MSKIEFWNEQYRNDPFSHGREPNEYFKSHIDTPPPGRVLLPAEGSGRNAVYAAKRGWQVDAFDYSEAGREKAIELAASEGTKINYELHDLEKYNPRKNHYDLIAVISVHVPETLRRRAFPVLIEGLVPSGTMLIEAFSVRQLEYDSGGPKEPSVLYHTAELAELFSELEIQELADVEVMLDEGERHQGLAMVTRMTARRS